MEIKLSNWRRNKPKAEENKIKGYATYGANNKGFTELIRLSKESPTNAAVLHGLHRLVYGKGLAARNSDGDNAAMFAKAIAMIPAKELRRGVIDDDIMANVAFKVTRSKDGKTAHIQHIPTQIVAPGLVDEEGEINSYHVSPELGKKDGNVKETQEFPNFDLFPDEKETIKYIS